MDLLQVPTKIQPMNASLRDDDDDEVGLGYHHTLVIISIHSFNIHASMEKPILFNIDQVVLLSAMIKAKPTNLR